MTERKDAGRARKSQFALFRSRNFMPLFATMFLGAFNDNFYKSALVILITYRLADASGIDARILVPLASGVLILPFLLFSALARQMADKYERSALIQKIKIAEIVVMSLGVVGFYTASVSLLMTVLFLMGAQSAFFGPLKYSVLPQHVAPDELLAANGLVEMGTFLAILFGTIFGGLFVLREAGILFVSLLVVGIATIGWIASRYIPPTRPIDPFLEFRFNVFRETAALINEVRPRREIFLTILGISWFYFVGGTFLSQFPLYAKNVVGADEQVATFFLAVFSIGIAVGSVACNVLLKGEVSGKYVSYAALGMSIAGVLLYFASLRPPLSTDVPLATIGEFLVSAPNLAVSACLFVISFFGGLYIVPLYAIVQSRSDEAFLASATACINVTDSFFMVLSSLSVSGMLWAGVSIPGIFLLISGLTLVAAWGIRGAMREC
ncbi:MFS transporter [Synergistaceae bacterium OttesenSCG-928-I11]|nr:MFS transporter [Synergistaceae bacterium OttesenSCG-928-I11]